MRTVIVIIASLGGLSSATRHVLYDITPDQMFPDIMKLRSAYKFHDNPCSRSAECPEISTSLLTTRDYFRSRQNQTKTSGRRHRAQKAQNSYSSNKRIKTIYKFPQRKG